VNYQEKVDTVRRRIFPRRESSASCDGKFCNSTCEGLDKCYVTEKSERQLDYILSSISTNIFLKACPGSGKTEVVGLKAAYEFHAWKQKNCGVAILTFTNNASDVIWDRVRQYAGLDKTVYPHFVGTIDSWLHGYLAHPFGHWITGYQGKTNDKSIRVVEDSVTGGWIKNYRCQTSYCSSPRNNNSPRVTPLYANMLRHNVETDGWEIKPLASSSEYQTDRDYYDSDGFKAFRSDKPWLTLECMRKDLSTSKTKFLRDGFATYHDVERICYCLLKERNDIAENLARRFPFIIVDECQDLSWIQLEILGLLKQAGITVHFVGDLNQAIYEFKKVEPKKVEEFVKNHNFEVQELSENFRSCQPIVDLCCKLVSGSSVIGKEPPSADPACVCFYYDPKDGLASLPKRFETYLKQPGMDPDKSAVLTRGWATVYKLQALKKGGKISAQEKLAMAIYLWSKGDRRLWSDAVSDIGDFVSSKYFEQEPRNSRNYYCPESVKSPLQWRLFLARVLEACLKDDDGISKLGQPWTEWAQHVRKRFSQIIDSCLPTLQNAASGKLKPAESITFNAPSGSKVKKVSDTLVTSSPTNYGIKVTTIHAVKGKTFDAVLLVSSPDQRGGKGGFWTEWLADTSSEHARFAYVASSRPRKVLAWAIPTPDESDKDLSKITDLGFRLLEIAS